MKNASILMLLFAVGCSQSQDANDTKDRPVSSQQAVSSLTDEFSDYWYAGKAEVNNYDLQQSRYGQMHKGNAILIFVTEPFSKSQQVKLDNAGSAGEDKQTVMKLNFVKKFTTGIYPYSMMLSAFTPVDRYHYPNTVKVSMSSQEWCGQVFTQMNLKDDQYNVHSFSYFQSEGDQIFTLKKTLLEDEIWNRIRLDYKSLPQGEIELIPGVFATRLRHKDLKPVKANATLTTEKDTVSYRVEFKDGRFLRIHFGLEFPHKILRWEERYRGITGKMLTTSGTLKKSLYIDYWNKNQNKFSYLRDSLGID